MISLQRHIGLLDDTLSQRDLAVLKIAHPRNVL
jgi:hypothetical protein